MRDQKFQKVIDYRLSLHLVYGEYMSTTGFGCGQVVGECTLKVIGRGKIGLYVYAKLWQLPINNISINVAILKKTNGYRPFLYNVTTNFCQFLANRKKYPFIDVFVGILVKDSNINHTCPYNHDIIVKNLVLDINKLKYLPFPRGEYRIDLKVAAYNDWKADVKTYFQIFEDL
ncbi:uncharacterized protein LOC133331654 [Musca vetustissima]|uniref:uncharacterized protein LOC133331654 n=1 Tax=Musca vetustissima TaxID=27455 RepID=UPI002AB77C23|nr:uncharacterized protein LOC133331654 [Musca vetustissima]